MNKTQTISFYRDSLLNSYGQVFFSASKGFSILLFIATLADPFVGACGFISLLITIGFAQWLGLPGEWIRNGSYGFNSLMVGLVLGMFYQINGPLLVVLFFGSVLALFLTVALGAILDVYRLPYLSIPFIIAVWILLLSTRNFAALELSERGIYAINDLWSFGGSWLVSLAQWSDALRIPWGLDIYLKSLGAIFFQYNLLSGFVIAVGLLAFSRIGFTLSLVGFYTGYWFSHLVQGNLPELGYSYIGFNFILAAIGIGGFYLIPSFKSYLLVVIITPLISLMLAALQLIMSGLQVPVYSLPFSITVMLIILVLGRRKQDKNLSLTVHQHFSPEENLYAYHDRLERYKNDTYYHVHLPFFGKWKVSQGHFGDVTHKGDWGQAWDFVVADEMGRTFRLPGQHPSDFYCYGLPVLAPAAGQIVTLTDHAEDNDVGKIDALQNWGNTIVIKHGELFYSKLSHLKAGSLSVKVGEYVQKGDMIATCGSSGRSPEPHIHFQLQTTPQIDARTLNYPISYYVSEKEGAYTFHAFEIPGEGEVISRPVLTPLLQEAFNFIPGTKMKFNVKTEKASHAVKWEVFVDSYNQSYIYCHNSDSYAYFTNNETLHYFTGFSGDRASLLYYFYLGAHKVMLGYYKGLSLQDVFPLEGFYKGLQKWMQDVVAPFVRYLRPKYTLSYVDADDPQQPNVLSLTSQAEIIFGSSPLRKIQFSFELKDHKIHLFSIRAPHLCIDAEQLV